MVRGSIPPALRQRLRMKSINTELTEAESALSELCKAIQGKVNSKEMRQEYHTLLNQATVALNKMRSISETYDFLQGWQQVGR